MTQNPFALSAEAWMMLSAPSLPCLGSELGLGSTVPLQPSCAPVTPRIRHVWQPASPLTHARMGCWARWTQSSARCWERAASALRAPSCTGATRHSASRRRSVVGSSLLRVGPSKAGLPLVSPSPSSCPMAEAYLCPSGAALGWLMSQRAPCPGQSAPHTPMSPVPPL